MSMKKYYPTAFALYMTYFVLGVAGSIMGQYKQELAALWGSGLLSDGTYDVSGVLAVIAALGLGRLISYPFAGPISDRFGRRVPALVGCALYFIFFAAVCYTRSYVLAYILGIVSGAANGFLMSGSRVAYQLAEMNTLPMSAALSKLNGNQVPANSILLIGLLGCIYSLSGQFDMMTNLGTFSCWIFYTLTFACVMKLRRTHPELERKYKVPLYPVIQILAILSGLYVIVSQLFLSSTEATLLSFGSILITLIGLPVYAIVKKRAAK